MSGVCRDYLKLINLLQNNIYLMSITRFVINRSAVRIRAGAPFSLKVFSFFYFWKKAIYDLKKKFSGLTNLLIKK